MSADIIVVPDLHDPAWVAWQADQITAITHEHRAGTYRFKQREQLLYQALRRAFAGLLDTWHDWEWDDHFGGVITVDPYMPQGHPYLGVVPLDELTFTAVDEARQSLLRWALADTETILRRTS
jgi:hypothetical protein